MVGGLVVTLGGRKGSTCCTLFAYTIFARVFPICFLLTKMSSPYVELSNIIPFPSPSCRDRLHFEPSEQFSYSLQCNLEVDDKIS